MLGDAITSNKKAKIKSTWLLGHFPECKSFKASLLTAEGLDWPAVTDKDCFLLSHTIDAGNM